MLARVLILLEILFVFSPDVQAAPSRRPKEPWVANTLQFEGNLKTLSLRIGSAVPTRTNGFDQLAKSGPTAQIQYLYYPWHWVAIGGELGFSRFGKQTASRDTTSVLGATSIAEMGIQAQKATLMMIGRVNLMPKNRSRWTPYLFGGVGANAFMFTLKGINLPDGFASHKTNYSSVGASVAGGTGLEVFVFQGFSLSFESRFEECYHTYQSINELPFMPRSVENASYTLGLHMWFGNR